MFMSEHIDRNMAKLASYIKEVDMRFAERLETAYRTVSKMDSCRIVRLSGPTCSGKTTAAEMLMRKFARDGKRAITVSIDDFFYDTDILLKLSKDRGTNEIDYDSVDTIDLAELGRFIEEIFVSDEVHCPIFDFSCGKRTGYRVFKIGSDDVFIFEGIQAVYPEVSDLLREHLSVGLFIAPLSPILTEFHTFDPNEIRLLRRLVRDHNFRNTPASFTFELWDGVRKNEEKSIFPYVDTCECLIDSTLQYEIGVLRPYLEGILSPIIENNDSPWRSSALKIIESVSGVAPIPSALVPADSLYKEFV